MSSSIMKSVQSGAINLPTIPIVLIFPYGREVRMYILRVIIFRKKLLMGCHVVRSFNVNNPLTQHYSKKI